jgi:hypothetical protein
LKRACADSKGDLGKEATPQRPPSRQSSSQEPAPTARSFGFEPALVGNGTIVTRSAPTNCGELPSVVTSVVGGVGVSVVAGGGVVEAAGGAVDVVGGAGAAILGVFVSATGGSDETGGASDETGGGSDETGGGSDETGGGSVEAGGGSVEVGRSIEGVEVSVEVGVRSVAVPLAVGG